MIGGAGMPFATNLLLGTAEGAITGGLDAALWGNDIGKGMLWGAAGGAIFTTLTSENFSNWTKGEKFMTNANLYQDMVSRGINNQDILNYFNVQGTYDPYHPDLFDNCGAPATTDKYTGEIFFNETAFDGGYDKLLATASHELRHRADVLSGNYQIGNFISFNKSELGAYLYNFRNQGLYPNHGYTNWISQINHFGANAGLDRYLQISPWKPAFWQRFIYNIPRRW